MMLYAHDLASIEYQEDLAMRLMREVKHEIQCTEVLPKASLPCKALGLSHSNPENPFQSCQTSIITTSRSMMSKCSVQNLHVFQNHKMVLYMSSLNCILGFLEIGYTGERKFEHTPV